MEPETNDSSTDEIKITPEMVEAGAGVIWRRVGDVFPYGSADARSLAKAVFLAMVARADLSGCEL